MEIVGTFVAVLAALMVHTWINRRYSDVRFKRMMKKLFAKEKLNGKEHAS